MFVSLAIVVGGVDAFVKVCVAMSSVGALVVAVCVASDVC